MTKSEPTVREYMSFEPYTIDAGQSLDSAEDLMRQKGIRHLPVTAKGELIGVISDRDVKMALGIVGSDPQLVKVIDICRDKPFKVSPDAKLHGVLDEMASKLYGSALVVQNEKLVGIFTTVDVCRAFSEILQQRFHV